MTIQSCTVGDTEIQFVPSPTADSQTIRIATTFGMHLAQLLGATQRDGPFFVLPHSAEVDHTLRGQFYSLAEVALILGVNKRRVMEWTRQGHLPVFRLGPQHRIMRVRKSDLEKFIENHIQGGPSTALDSP